MGSSLQSVCVFCGSSPGRKPVYRATAEDLGTAIARRGWRLVYGGAHVGLMGVVADAALAAGGEVIGVIPESLSRREIAHTGLTQLINVRDLQERKTVMADHADAFIALPGGFGTLDEIFEVLTWAQLGLHAKPCGLLNVESYFDGLLALLDRAVEEGFLRPEHRGYMLAEPAAAPLLDSLASANTRRVNKVDFLTGERA